MRTTVNERITIHRGRTFSLLRENITLENGAVTDLDIIRHPGAAAIVPILGENKIVLVKQYRHALGRRIWEIPAGTMNPGETGSACAERELVEETGYSASRWDRLGSITPVPGYSDELVHLYLARDLAPAEQNLDHDEVLDVHEIPLDEAMTMVRAGSVTDAKTICGLFMTLGRLREEGQHRP